MSMDPEEMKHFQVVDTRTGQAHPLASYLQPLSDAIEGLQRDIRGWTSRYADLRRNKVTKAKESALWDLAAELFEFWRQECNHKRSKFTVERFWLIEPFLEDTEHYGPEICRRAIAGAAFDPFTTKRKNGSTKRHDDWELIFRNAGKVEEFCNRAPQDWDKRGENQPAPTPPPKPTGPAEAEAAQFALQEPREET